MIIVKDIKRFEVDLTPEGLRQFIARLEEEELGTLTYAFASGASKLVMEFTNDKTNVGVVV